MEKAIGYIRVSTQGQVKDGYSLSYQLEEIQKYCSRRHLQLLGLYEDKGISGAKVDEEGLSIEREGLQEMLSDLKGLKVEYLVVLNTSRLWRSDMVKVLIQKELKKNQIDVKSIEQPNYSIYSHDPNDFLVNGMLELLDQYQRLEIALKLSRGRKKKAQQGGYAGGRAAFGYTARKGQKGLRIDQQQAETVKRLFTLKELHPLWSLSQLAGQLNREGFTTAQGKAFTKVQVKRLLDRKDFYSGIYQYGQITSRGDYLPIL